MSDLSTLAADHALSQRTAHALLIALRALKSQNDHLAETNIALVSKNNEHCNAINDMAEIIVTMKRELEEEKRRVRTIGDALTTLYGQLAATGVIDEKRQRGVPVSPVTGMPVTEALGVSDLYCEE